MASMQYYVLAMYPYSGPSILMGDDSEIQVKVIGRIDLEDGYFNNVLRVLDIATNILFIYQMTHTRKPKRVTFTQNDVDISEIYTCQVVLVKPTNKASSIGVLTLSMPN